MIKRAIDLPYIKMIDIIRTSQILAKKLKKIKKNQLSKLNVLVN